MSPGIARPTLAVEAHDSRTGASEAAGSSSAALPSSLAAEMGRPATGFGAVLDLPVPPSVNKARRINWTTSAQVKRWHEKADAVLLTVRYRPLKIKRFDLHITFSEQHCKMDLDNGLKALIDYLRRIEAIVDDAKKNMRRITVEWGEAPQGCRVQILPLEAA